MLKYETQNLFREKVIKISLSCNDDTRPQMLDGIMSYMLKECAEQNW